MGHHLQEELPALGIVILLRENLAEAGEDSEAVPGGWGAAALRRGLAQLPTPSPDSPPGPCPPHLVASPRLPEACGWGWIAGLIPQHTLKRNFGADGTPVGSQIEITAFGRTSFHTLIPNRAKPLSYLCHADPLLQEPGPLGRTKWPYGHLSKPFSS